MSFIGWKHEVIQYNGDGVNGRTISTSFSLTEGRVAVLVLNATAQAAIFRHNQMFDGSAKAGSSSIGSNFSNLITGFTSSGFTVGTANEVNKVAPNNSYIALVMRDTTTNGDFMQIGTYNGTGAGSGTVDHYFGPTRPTTWLYQMLMIWGRNPVFWTNGMASNESLVLVPEAQGSFTDKINGVFYDAGLDQTFFRTGDTSNNVNSTLITYSWMALSGVDVATPVFTNDIFQVSSYTGTAVEPDVVALATGTGSMGVPGMGLAARRTLVGAPNGGGWIRSEVSSFHGGTNSTTFNGTVDADSLEDLGTNQYSVGSNIAPAGSNGFSAFWSTTGSDGSEDGNSWWVFAPGSSTAGSGTMQYSATQPTTDPVTGETTTLWEASASGPDDTGWWQSIEDNFGGAATVIDDGVPRDPRTFTEISAFAAGGTATGMMGGFPGTMVSWNNRLLYAKGGYTVATNPPPVHIFDGQFDRQLLTVPNTTAGAVPRAVMTMLAEGSDVFVATLDTGSSDADWVGRVFSLSVETGQLTQLGSVFPTGHVPYSLTWHLGRLWCGTNRKTATNNGRVYFIRPGIDTDWTLDRNLSSDTQCGAVSMMSYKGDLYIGCSGATGTFAKVIKRATSNSAYSTSLTATGGSAIAHNAFLAMTVFGNNLYASYWNPDTTRIAKIYKFDGSSWTTVFTASTDATRVPYIGFPTDLDVLFALGGGISYLGTLLRTTDGSSWTNITSFLTQTTPMSTAVPAFGVVVR